VDELQVPRLSTYGVSVEQIAGVTEQAKRASSMKGNPVALTDEELAEALHAAM
jgi:alcohol dehydrogenase class IV